MQAISLLFTLFLTSCSWVATHPQQDAAVIEIAEECMQDLYTYETRTLSPGPQLPPGTPPMKLQGPSGP